MAEIPAFGGHFGAHVIPAASPPIIESPGASLQAPGRGGMHGRCGVGVTSWEEPWIQFLEQM